MKEKKGSGVEKGAYIGTFHKIVPPQGSKKLLHSGKNGPYVRYLCKSQTGLEIPGSFPFDADDYRMQNMLGAMGTPLSAVKQWMDSMNPTQFLRRLSSLWTKKPIECNMYVQDNGYIVSIRPNTGSFIVEFERITSRENDEPIHKKKTHHRSDGSGSWETDTFSVVLKVVAGDHEGCGFLYTVHYPIEKADDGEWWLDTSKKGGKAFDQLMLLHGINVRNFDPTDYSDPTNLLPVFEPLMKQAGVTILIEVEGGWITKIMENPQSKPSRDFDAEFGQPEPTQAKVEPQHLAILKQVVNATAEADETPRIFNKHGEPDKTRWKAFVNVYDLPRKLPSRYAPMDTITALQNLGYDDLATTVKRISKPKKKKSSRRRRRRR